MRLHPRLVLVFLVLSLAILHGAQAQRNVFVIELLGPVDQGSWSLLQKGFRESAERRAELIVLRINTYGGQVDMADSMRTLILNSRVPVWAFVDNQAASAGALISLACDSIYMREGASIGAATVVEGTGEAAPDKYQSFMRGMMRATAQAKGGEWVPDPEHDSIFRYRRTPEIAESMVDPSIAIPGVIDSGHVLTLTAHEAQDLGFCEAIAESIPAILHRAGLQEPDVSYFRPSGLDKFKSFMLSPFVSGLLIMLIIGGLYFELQTPGVGFPLIVAILAAITYFMPLYIEGLVQNVDLILFIVGLGLLLLEIFVIPGFGIAGIAGIVATVAGLTLSLVDNDFIFSGEFGALRGVLLALSTVLGSLTLAVILSLVLSQWLLTNPSVPALALRKNLDAAEGYVGLDVPSDAIIGRTGIARTVLRPGGKVEIDGVSYDAIALHGMVGKGSTVVVRRIEASQVYVVEQDESI